MSDILNLKGLTNFSANGTNKEIKVLDTDWSELFDSTKATTIDMRGFDTSNVTNMSWLFGHCKSLRSLNISNFDTSKVTDMSDMFGYCDSLTSLQAPQNLRTA
ncbi:BspA family leucine-rich repeat surface protein [Lactococcus taiwanensis]|uniref:BspA family leucine-rich repeat surface protein n=1 Tax=Lactococcus taiwanensis TaxID=1151742 RepID=UPI0035141725